MLGARVGAAAVVAGAIAVGASGAGAAATPHITAVPNNLMVNTYTTLVGTGFTPHTSYSIAECGAPNWIAPQDPCDTNNTITVVTDAQGAFVHKLKAELCPRTLPPTPPVTQETCWVGAPKGTGVDTIALEGAAKLTVTYP